MFGVPDPVLDQLIVVTAWVHVLLAPYTKVEESFNLHATHDVLMYGVRPNALHQYDHFVFPGAVPRTFLGSVLLACISKPVIHLAGLFSPSQLPTKFDLQVIVRLVLAAFNALALCLIRRAVSRRFGRSTGLFFILLTCSQFHLPFWMGRTLPNMFALLPVNTAWYLILDMRHQTAKFNQRTVDVVIFLLTFTTIVLRFEVILLLAPVLLQFLASGSITLSRVARVGAISGVISLAITVALDSFFWNRWPLWPELAGLYFNIYQGKSSAWGVSPFHSYFTAHLPKLLLGSLPLSILGARLDPSIRSLLFPPIAFICLISCLGHKEWRFIVYVVPIFNVAAARGASWLTSYSKRDLRGRLFSLIAIGIIVANTVLTTLQTKASVHNYPGGLALASFNSKYGDRPHVHIHISNLAAQTGASLFLQTHSPPYRSFFNSSTVAVDWTYNKTESLSLANLTSAKQFTHLIAEEPCPGLSDGWDHVDDVVGFEEWKVNLGAVTERIRGRSGDVLMMRTHRKLCILERTTTSTEPG